MKAFAYHYGATGVAWYRTWQIVKYLKAKGVDIKRLPNESDRIHIPLSSGQSNWPGVRNHVEIAEEHDVIISQYHSVRSNVWRLLGQAEKAKLIVDIDDDVYSIHKSNANYNSWIPQDDSYEELMAGEENSQDIQDRVKRLEGIVTEQEGKKYFFKPGEDRRENVELLLKHAHLVTVSTPELARIYKRLNPNVHVVPNGVDFDLWKPIENDTGRFRIGMTGSNTHVLDWYEANEGIKQFLDEHPDADLIMNCTLNMVDGFTGERFDKSEFAVPQIPAYFEKLFKEGRIKFRKPSEVEEYPTWLAENKFDVILAPLADITFNKSKSNIKYLEASALKIPFIGQDMEPYNRDVKHGVNGLLCKAPADWYKRIKWVYENRKEAKTLANRAWMDVKNRYDMVLIAEKYERMLTNFVNEVENETVNRQPAFA